MKSKLINNYILWICMLWIPLTYAGVPIKDATKSKIEPNAALEDNFTDVYNNYYSKVISINNVNATPANYFGFDAKDLAGKINYSYPFFKKDKKLAAIVAGKIEGTLTDNIIKLVEEKKFLPGIAFSVNVSLPFRSRFFYLPADMINKNAIIGNTNTFYGIKTSLLDNEIDKLTEEQTKLLSIVNDPSPKATAFRIKEIDLKLNELNTRKTALLIQKEQSDSIKNIDLAFNYSTVSLTWVDFYTEVSRKQFNLLNDTFARSSFKEQLETKHKFTGVKVGASLNAFYQSRYKGYKLFSGYYKLNLFVSRINNTDGMETYDVSESIKSKDTLSTAERSIGNKLTSFNNLDHSYKENYAMNIGFDVYKFISKNQVFSLHLFNEYVIRVTDKQGKSIKDRCLANVGFGFVFSATNKKDKTPVNIEPYVKFTDLFNTNSAYNAKESLDRISKRNEIGIKVNVNLPSLIKSK